MIRLLTTALLGQILFAPDGGSGTYIKTLKCVGAGTSCSTSGAVGFVTVSADGGLGAVPGAPPYSVQYNNAGAFGGAARVFIDGGNLGIAAMVNAHPPTPGGVDHALIYEWLATTGMPTQPMSIDNAMALPMPVGRLAEFSLVGTSANWRLTGCQPAGFGSSNINEIGVISSVTCGINGGSCTASGPSWASTNLYTRGPVTLSTKTSATGANTWCGHHYIANPSVYFWRGANTGEGGFFWWTRVFIVTWNNDGLAANKMFAGMLSVTAVPSASVEPSTYTNTAYFGTDIWGTTLQWCTNDNSGSATCTNLGANFSLTSGAWYDLYIWAPPATATIYSAAVRLDSAQNSGLISTSSNLPLNTLQYTWMAMIGSTGVDAGPVAIANGGALTLWNY